VFYLDKNTLAGFTNRVQLVNYLETYDARSSGSGAADGAKSALAISGPGRFSLLDYASRLFPVIGINAHKRPA
jgi:hypothetical protein